MTSQPERRRSPRLLLDVGLIVRGQLGETEFKEPTFTVSVNAHGALIFLGAAVKIGQTLFLTNPLTETEIQGHVTRLGPAHSGLRMVGVEFEVPSKEFWGLSSERK